MFQSQFRQCLGFAGPGNVPLLPTGLSTNDHQILQNDLNLLIKWSTDWKMDFNISKCKILQITIHHNKSVFTYQMLNSPLETVLEHNHLGIRLHHKLSWELYISYICNKANRLLGFLKRNLYNAPLEIKEHVYKQLLLPPSNIVVPSGTLTIKQVTTYRLMLIAKTSLLEQKNI